MSCAMLAVLMLVTMPRVKIIAVEFRTRYLLRGSFDSSSVAIMTSSGRGM